MSTAIETTRNIILIDKYALTRYGLTNLIMSLEGKYEICLQVESVERFIESGTDYPVDAVVADFFGSPEEIKKQAMLLYQFNINVPVIIYTSAQDPKILFFLSNIAKFNVISRQEPIDVMRSNIECALDGTRIISPIIHGIINGPEDGERVITANLTPQENEVLSYYLKGMNLSQIAKVKNRSIKTISAQKCSGMRKIGATSDADLFLFKRKVLNYLRAN